MATVATATPVEDFYAPAIGRDWHRRGTEAEALLVVRNAVPPTRSIYAASGSSRPLALLASAGILAAMAAVLATMGIVAEHKRHTRLTTVDVHELDVTPPPPPPRPAKPQQPQPPPATPKPMLSLPSEGPKQVVVDIPPPMPPPAPSRAATEGATSKAAPAAPLAPPASSASGDLSSTLLVAKPPVYPLDARRRRAEGTVKLWVVVGADGRVEDIRVSHSSGTDSLDRAALQAVKRWRWKPSATGDAGSVSIPFTIRD